MAISAGSIISATDILAGLVVVDAKDTGTISSPAGTYWTRTAGPLVEVQFTTTGTLAAGSSATLWTLDSALRPASPVAIACAGGVSLDREVSGVINTDGTVVVRNNYSSAIAIGGHALYLLP